MENTNEEFKKKQSQDLAELAEKNKREEEQKPSFDEIKKRFVCTPYKRLSPFCKDNGERFIPLRNETSLKRQVEDLLGNDEIKQLLKEIEDNPILYCYNKLAGYPYGIHRFGGKNVLVMESAPWIEGKKGDWATIEKFLRSRFYDPKHPEQFHIFMGWLKSARKKIREAMEKGYIKTACQYLVIAGGQDIGKTGIILKLLIAPLLATEGESIYDGSKYLAQATEKGYNGKMLEYPLIMLDDVHKGASMKVRENIFGKAKNILYGGAVSVEEKGVECISVNLPWAVVHLTNLDDKSLRAVPIVGADEDKFIGLLAGEYQDAPPFTTDKQKDELKKKIAEELSAFAYAVDNYEVPEELQDSKSNRHCCMAWVHPKLAEMIHEISPDARLIELIDMSARRADMASADAIYQEDAKPSELYNAVKDNLPSNYKREFEQLSGGIVAFGKKLKAISEKPNSCVIRRMSGNNPLYMILRPTERNEKWE